MSKQLSLEGKKVLVMGLGLHHGGEGVARFMAEHGAQVTVTDLKKPEQLESTIQSLSDYPIRYVLGEHREEDFTNADIVVRNPAVPRESRLLQIARGAGAAIEMEMSIFFRMCPAPIIGVTGTKGKTTTTMLLGELLKNAGLDVVVAGNLRISALEALPRISHDSVVVLELSSWQLEGLADAHLSPHTAVVTNIHPDHLDRYKTMEDYIKAKRSITWFQRSNDHLVLNAEDEAVRVFADNTEAGIVWFGVADPGFENACFVNDGLVIWRFNGRDEVVCSVSDLRLPGRANLLNALAAVAAAKLSDASNCGIKAGLSAFTGAPERLELIAEVGGVRYYDDTTSTTPASTVASIEAVPKPIVLIAGGSEKHLDFAVLAAVIARNVDEVVLLDGTATERLRNAIAGAGWRKQVHRSGSMAAAVQSAALLAKDGGSVLMSPACASFGMFVNEFDRGDAFKRAVAEVRRYLTDGA